MRYEIKVGDDVELANRVEALAMEYGYKWCSGIRNNYAGHYGDRTSYRMEDKRLSFGDDAPTVSSIEELELLLKRERREPEQKFAKVGDTVLVVAEGNSHGYEVGKKYVVVGLHPSNYKKYGSVSLEGGCSGSQWIRPAQYKVVEPEGEEKFEPFIPSFIDSTEWARQAYRVWDRIPLMVKTNFSLYGTEVGRITIPTKKEKQEMYISKVETKHYVNGTEVSTISLTEQIELIKGTQARIKELEDLSISTTAIEAEKKRLKEDLAKAVELFNK